MPLQQNPSDNMNVPLATILPLTEISRRGHDDRPRRPLVPLVQQRHTSHDRYHRIINPRSRSRNRKRSFMTPPSPSSSTLAFAFLLAFLKSTSSAGVSNDVEFLQDDNRMDHHHHHRAMKQRRSRHNMELKGSAKQRQQHGHYPPSPSIRNRNMREKKRPRAKKQHQQQNSQKTLPLSSSSAAAAAAQCHPEGKWHISTTVAQICTNDDNIPPSWELPAVRDNFLFDDWLQCCEAMFGTDSESCGHEDFCGNDAGAGGDGAGAGPENADCEYGKWHVSRSGTTTCTNSDDFPSYWNDDYYLGKTMFFSQYGCCESLRGLGTSSNCYVHNACTGEYSTLPLTPASGSGSSSISSAAATSCSALWHPTPTFEGCSNSPPGSYPHDWAKTPAASQRYLYNTHEECCAGVFDYEEYAECPMTNHCPETGMPSSQAFACPVSGHKWHKGLKRNTCTNDLEYPSAWNDPAVANNFLFDTFVECCAKYASAESSCTVVDICETRSTVIGPGQLSDLLAELLVVDSPTVSPATLPVTPTMAVGCGQNKPRKCVKDPECSWDRTTKTCVALVPVEADEDVDEKVDVQLDEKVDEGKGNRIDIDGHADEHADDCGKKYHPTSVLERKCTNDSVYPSIWDSPDETRVYFFTSSADCCAYFYSGGPCHVVNICSATD